MKFLLDTKRETFDAYLRDYPDLVGGQLITPLTRRAWIEGRRFAIDNGCFAKFRRSDWVAKLEQLRDQSLEWCHFVAMPDIVGNAKLTLDLFWHWTQCLETKNYRRALVLQDGIEDCTIPWGMLDAVFVGGTDDYKESAISLDMCRAALRMDKHVHVGRVNTPGRYCLFAELGCHTCDGSGVAQYSHMMKAIANAVENHNRPSPLFDYMDREPEYTCKTYDLEHEPSKLEVE